MGGDVERGDHRGLPVLRERGADGPRQRLGVDPALRVLRETLEQRLAEEEPEVWAVHPRMDPAREPDRAGRLVEDDEAVEAGGNDEFAIDAGISGGAATAEEAAVHLIEEEYTTDEDLEEDEGQEGDEA